MEYEEDKNFEFFSKQKEHENEHFKSNFLFLVDKPQHDHNASNSIYASYFVINFFNLSILILFI